MKATYLKAKLRLQQTVEGLAICASIGIVDAVIGTHYVTASSMNGILEWPIESF